MTTEFETGEGGDDEVGRRPGWVALLTIASLVAFAGNSVLCRLALLADQRGAHAIDAVSFTAVRILSGALVLAPALMTRANGFPRPLHGVSWTAVLALAVYAITFSLSYVTLPAGVGALLLFGFVQITMVGAGLAGGERMSPRRAAGMATAIAGVLVLVAPSSAALAADAPDLGGVALMAIAGVAWGVYSLCGRGQAAPVRMTAMNFALCAPLALVTLALAGSTDSGPTWTARGLGLAAASGAVTSGAGYAIWYAALRGHTRTSAAVVQLTVPVLAAAGGVLWLGESVTGRLVAASVLVLGGVAAALAGGRRTRSLRHGT